MFRSSDIGAACDADLEAVVALPPRPSKHGSLVGYYLKMFSSSWKTLTVGVFGWRTIVGVARTML